jgi:hypothetical protein
MVNVHLEEGEGAIPPSYSAIRTDTNIRGNPFDPFNPCSRSILLDPL